MVAWPPGEAGRFGAAFVVFDHSAYSFMAYFRRESMPQVQHQPLRQLEQKRGDVVFVNADSGVKLSEIKKRIKVS
ncbi:hypothetical protein RB628_17500 [Streptomyces sp. ADMS]|uniref:hypothetical protein n=1 Tax=Streptomyces sp. ADMS TaxID=3071415 RepID=UPI00296E7D3B|nr:hypothetical protein [Streptomyces sp. ADMS]MDW4907095.1 hypothetical protein [Streptomyces sp. ADMS]